MRVLDVSQNQLAKLPDGIGGCTALEILRASQNTLLTLPVTIGFV